MSTSKTNEQAFEALIERALIGTTLEERAMPNSTESTIAPWFGQRGLGIQYRLPCSVETLLQTGKIKEVKT